MKRTPLSLVQRSFLDGMQTAAMLLDMGATRGVLRSAINVLGSKWEVPEPSNQALFLTMFRQLFPDWLSVPTAEVLSPPIKQFLADASRRGGITPGLGFEIR